MQQTASMRNSANSSEGIENTQHTFHLSRKIVKCQMKRAAETVREKGSSRNVSGRGNQVTRITTFQKRKSLL